MKTDYFAAAAVLIVLAPSADASTCVKVPRERFVAFIEQMRPNPVFRNGETVGYRVYERTSGNKLAALGLKSGDLLTHFCGLPITDVWMGEGDLCCKRAVDEVVYVDIERDDEKMRVKSSIPPRK